jgi:hypothetical protein
MTHPQPKFERIGVDDASGRALFVVAVDQPDDVSEVIFGKNRHFTGYFVALIACNAEAYSVSELARLARRLLDAGCVYFCCWGPGCERVHDVIDEVYAGDGMSISDDESTIMTTWHNEEDLEGALWFTLNVAFPDDSFFDDCRSVVAFSIGSRVWEQRLAAALADTRSLEAHRDGGDAA